MQKNRNWELHECKNWGHCTVRGAHGLQATRECPSRVFHTDLFDFLFLRFHHHTTKLSRASPPPFLSPWPRLCGHTNGVERITRARANEPRGVHEAPQNAQQSTKLRTILLENSAFQHTKRAAAVHNRCLDRSCLESATREHYGPVGYHIKPRRIRT